ncbi:hypothetical protein GJ496_010913 [Pomphorhynchus laevis]|nr:hypothetical protein GJ496_010913 [Pomphorhynchus laevis]
MSYLRGGTEEEALRYDVAHNDPIGSKLDDLNWVETYLDSGINSGVSSRGPESIAVPDDWITDIKEHSTRAQRIKNAMFADNHHQMSNKIVADMPTSDRILQNGNPLTAGVSSISTSASAAVVNHHSQQHSAVSKLSQPSQLLKSAVVSLVHYQDDADLAERALPELVRLLNDDDLVVVAQAASMLSRLAKREASKSVVCRNSAVLEGLVQAVLRSDADTELSRHAAIVFHSASLTIDKCDILADSHLCISALVRLLGCSVESVVCYAVTTLHNIMQYRNQVKELVQAVGGVQQLTKLLNRTNDKFLAVVSDCLHIIAFANPEAKLTILANDGPTELLRILQSTKYEKLLWTTTRLLKVLSVCEQNKRNLLERGVIPTMCSVLHRSDVTERVSHNCLYTVRNLSDLAIKLEGLDVLIRLLIEYLTSTDRTIVSCAAGILSNLTCNNQINKQIVVQHNGVEALIRTLIQASKEETVESTICALRHLTCRHKLAPTAQESIRLCFGLPAVVRLLNPSGNSWTLLKATVGLVRNLAMSISNAGALRENGAIGRLISVVKAAYKSVISNDHSRKRTIESSFENSAPSVSTTHLARAELVLKTCFGALHSIARDANNRKAICDQSNSFFSIIRELLINDYTSFGVIRSLLCLCNELVNVQVALNHLIKSRSRIVELSASDDDGIAAFALALLQKIGDEPNGQAEYSLDA